MVNKRTKVHFKVMIVLAVLIYFSAHQSIVWVAWAIVAGSVIGFFWNSYVYIRSSQWRWKDTYSSLRPALSMLAVLIPVLFAARYAGEALFSVHSLSMLIPVPFAASRMGEMFLFIHSFAMLIILSLLAAVTFFGANFLFKFAEVKEIIDLVTGKTGKKAKRMKQKELRNAENT